MRKNEAIRIYDIETLPFGSKVKVKHKDGKSERGVSVVGGIALEKSGSVLEHSIFNQEKIEVYI